jgi:hypothetical protein
MPVKSPKRFFVCESTTQTMAVPAIGCRKGIVKVCSVL